MSVPASRTPFDILKVFTEDIADISLSNFVSAIREFGNATLDLKGKPPSMSNVAEWVKSNAKTKWGEIEEAVAIKDAKDAIKDAKDASLFTTIPTIPKYVTDWKETYPDAARIGSPQRVNMSDSEAKKIGLQEVVQQFDFSRLQPGGAGAEGVAKDVETVENDKPIVIRTPIKKRTRAARKEQVGAVVRIKAKQSASRTTPFTGRIEISQIAGAGSGSGAAAGGGSGASDTIETPATPFFTFGRQAANAPPVEQRSQTLMQQPLVVNVEQQTDAVNAVEELVPGEEETKDNGGASTTESSRQNELGANESATLDYKPNFTEVMDPIKMRLATDKDRGNLGAGTTADMQSADVWGNMFTQHASDLKVQPERVIKTKPGGVSVEETETEEVVKNVYSFLPFAKLGGDIVWIPRHGATAKFFFTAQDYEELVSHVRDGDPLTLDKMDEVDSTVMMSTILKTYGTLKMFCQLGPVLPMSASTEQIYAEWLEMRQIGKAVARYQQLTGGMYENTELSMKGGIRAAVASSLKPFIQAWNQLHKDQQIGDGSTSTRPLSGPMFSGKRKAESGIVEPEEYNPQFSYQPVDLKRVKFSIPSI